MMEYFIIDKWQVAVNVLNDGYETYRFAICSRPL